MLKNEKINSLKYERIRWAREFYVHMPAFPAASLASSRRSFQPRVSASKRLSAGESWLRSPWTCGLTSRGNLEFAHDGPTRQREVPTLINHAFLRCRGRTCARPQTFNPDRDYKENKESEISNRAAHHVVCFANYTNSRYTATICSIWNKPAVSKVEPRPVRGPPQIISSIRKFHVKLQTQYKRKSTL